MNNFRRITASRDALAVGKTVFPTREEAEKVLEAMSDG